MRDSAMWHPKTSQKEQEKHEIIGFVPAQEKVQDFGFVGDFFHKFAQVQIQIPEQTQFGVDDNIGLEDNPTRRICFVFRDCRCRCKYTVTTTVATRVVGVLLFLGWGDGKGTDNGS